MVAVSTASTTPRSSPAATAPAASSGACPRATSRATRRPRRPRSARSRRRPGIPDRSCAGSASSTTGSPATTAGCTRWCTTSCSRRSAGTSRSRATPTARPRTSRGSRWPSCTACSPTRTSGGSPRRPSSARRRGMSGRSLRRRVLARPWLSSARSRPRPLRRPPPTADPDLPVTVEITEVTPRCCGRARTWSSGRRCATPATRRSRSPRPRCGSAGSGSSARRLEVGLRRHRGLSRTGRDTTVPVAAPLLPGRQRPGGAQGPRRRASACSRAPTPGARAGSRSRRWTAAGSGSSARSCCGCPPTTCRRRDVRARAGGRAAADPRGRTRRSRARGADAGPGGASTAAVVAADADDGVAVDPALLGPTRRARRAPGRGPPPHGRLRTHDVVALPGPTRTSRRPRTPSTGLVQPAVDRAAQTGPRARHVLRSAVGTRTETPDQATAAVTARVGADAIVVPPVHRDGLPGRRPVRPRGSTRRGSVTAFRPDAGSARCSRRRRTRAGATPTAAVQRALAETAVITRERDGAAPPARDRPDWDPDAQASRALLDALDSGPGCASPRCPPCSTPASPTPTAAAPAPPPPTSSPSLRAGLRTPGHSRALPRSPRPGHLLEGVDAEVLAPTSVAWRVDPAGRALVAPSSPSRRADRGPEHRPGQRRQPHRRAARSRRVVNGPDRDGHRAARVSRAGVPGGRRIPEVTSTRGETTCGSRCAPVPAARGRRAADRPGRDGRLPDRGSPCRWRRLENVGTAVVAGLLALGLVVGIVRTVRRGQTAPRGPHRRGGRRPRRCPRRGRRARGDSTGGGAP